MDDDFFGDTTPQQYHPHSANEPQDQDGFDDFTGTAVPMQMPSISLSSRNITQVHTQASPPTVGPPTGHSLILKWTTKPCGVSGRRKNASNSS